MNESSFESATIILISMTRNATAIMLPLAAMRRGKHQWQPVQKFQLQK